MQFLDPQLVQTFRTEAKRQEEFTNSFARQLAVILLAIILINWLGPKIIFWETNIIHGDAGSDQSY
jgi:hypothetical protein